MDNEALKKKQERLLEMFVKAYIDEKRFYEMLERIRKEK